MSKLLHFLFYRVLFFTFAIFLSGLISYSSAAGLPEEYLLTQRWRTLFSTNSPLTNPSFINEENYLCGRIVYTSILGEFPTIEGGVVYPIGLYQTAGLTWVRQGLRKPYARTDTHGDPTGEMISDNSDYIIGTYSNNLWGGLTLGANANILLRQFDDASSIGGGIDFGLSYHAIQNPFIGTHTVGLDIQNLLFVPVTGSEFADVLPRAVRLSLNSFYIEHQVESSIDFSLKDLGTPSSFFNGESAKAEWNLDAKVGGWILKIFKVYGLLGLNEESFAYYGLAGGVNIPTINNGRDLSFLIQYLNVPDVEDQSPSSFLSMYLRADIGKHREEIYARKMARLAQFQPNELWVKGVKLYTEGNYWDAFFIFSQLFVEYPDFFKSDWVSYFLGACQEKMDMRLTAEEAFKKTKELYSRSSAVPFADLGLMRVYYRDGNFGAVEAQFNELNKLGVPDSIKYHGYYYMGQTEMKKGSFSKAKQLFELVPETHPDYVFAQHSMAICNASTDNYEGAITNLENCIQSNAVTESQKEMVNRSYVYIGYIFYEELTEQEGPLAKAVTAFRMVPKTSRFYVDALLGLGWTALKARQWSDCKNAGSELSSIAPNIVMKAEGSLLEAYAYMMEKDYNAAATALAGAVTDLEGYHQPSQAELMSQQDENNALRGKYTEVARKAYDLGTSRQSDIVMKQIDSLHTHQKAYKEKIDEFLEFVDSFERNTFFSRNFESIKEDVEYALAKCQNLGGQVQLKKEYEKANKKEEQIDDELEKLKKQLEKEQNKAGMKENDAAPGPEPEPEIAPEPAPAKDLPEEDLPMDDLPEDEGWEE